MSHKNYYIAGLTALVVSTAITFATSSSAALTDYSQNFERMTPLQGWLPNDLSADDLEILPVLASNDSGSVIVAGNTEAPSSLDGQTSGTDIMRGSIWHIDFTEVDGKPKQTTSIAYIEREGTPNIGDAGAVPSPNSSWFAVVEVHNKEMALVLKSSDKAVQQKELFKAAKGDRLVAWPAWSPSGDQIAIIHVQLDKQRRRFSYNIIIADIN